MCTYKNNMYIWVCILLISLYIFDKPPIIINNYFKTKLLSNHDNR